MHRVKTLFLAPRQSVEGQEGTSSLPPGGDSVPEELAICGPSREAPEDSLCPVRVTAAEDDAGRESGPARGAPGSGGASEACWGLSSPNWATGRAFHLPPPSGGHSSVRQPLPPPTPLPPARQLRH